jgi:hypothetical protein
LLLCVLFVSTSAVVAPVVCGSAYLLTKCGKPLTPPAVQRNVSCTHRVRRREQQMKRTHGVREGVNTAAHGASHPPGRSLQVFHKHNTAAAAADLRATQKKGSIHTTATKEQTKKRANNKVT